MSGLTFEMLDKYVFDADSYTKNKKTSERYPYMKPMRDFLTLEQVMNVHQTEQFFHETENGNRQEFIIWREEDWNKAAES